MPHGPEEHLEHAEHAQHAAHDPFDRRVAMTMAIVAAVLACVTMLSHREHTETLRLQNDANAHQTKANDQWNYSQAKKDRSVIYQVSGKMVGTLSNSASDSKDGQDLAGNWGKMAEDYRKQSEEIQEKARQEEHQAETLQEESHRAHHRADRYDLGELGVELALVLCSLAVLTKRPAFWYGGIGFGVLGACVATTGLFL
jgi:hypothetical protein